MIDGTTVKVVIPALNEAASIGHVLADIPIWVDEVIVADNGSTDATAQIAACAGARVVHEDRRGYGQACLTGMAAIDWCDVVVFLDADYSDYPGEMVRLLSPILANHAEMVIGSRTLGRHEPGCFTLPQRFGNLLSCHLMRMIWRFKFTDLGPFRAIRWPSLQALKMRDRSYGWTVEMQVKALASGLRVAEVPVSYRKRMGASKISGTIRGVIGAGTKILGTIARYAIAPPAIRAAKPERLIIFTRYPRPGQAKTRLIPAIGPLAATEIHRRLVVKAVREARDLAGQISSEVQINYCGADERSMRRWLGSGVTYTAQSKGDLGERMVGAFDRAFASGCRRVVLCGTDVPAPTVSHQRQAFTALESYDIVLGPTSDGGYWLVGSRRPAKIFDGVAWSTEHVLRQTLDAVRRRGLTVCLLPPLDDLDRPEDLSGVEPAFSWEHPFISVVIPATNEAFNIEATIRSAGRPHVEIIVVDGGSTDRTMAVASALGAKVIASLHGRAKQMNVGARIARGEILLFLHADTVLPANYDRFIFSAMLDQHAVGGGHYRCDMQDGSITPGNQWARLRINALCEPWGAQAIFVRRSTFEAIGGFPDALCLDPSKGACIRAARCQKTPNAGDWFFMQKLKHRGNIVINDCPVFTPSRRLGRIGGAGADPEPG